MTLLKNALFLTQRFLRFGVFESWRLCVVLLFLFAACQSQEAAPVGPPAASGFIEADKLNVAPQVGGRVLTLTAEIGAQVAAGDPLVYLDARVAQAQVALAEGRVAEAQARLDMARQGVTEAEIQVAEAQRAQAAAGRVGACQAWADARAILEDPQALNRQIAVTQAHLRAADAARAIAGAYKDVAGIAQEQFEDGRERLADVPDKVLVYEGDISDVPFDLPQEILDFLQEHPPPSGTYRFGDNEIIVEGHQVSLYRHLNIYMPVEAHFAPNYYWQAWVGVHTAQAGYAGTRDLLNLLYRMRAHPTQILAQVDRAEAQCRQAEAQEAMAQAQVDGLRQGATAQEIAALEALYRQAQAELEQARIALGQQTLVAPVNGIVLDRPLEAGELAGPGAPLYMLADLDAVYLTLYLPVRELGRVALGDAVGVTVASFPRENFAGTVTFIGMEAEFPPQNVPQPEDRATLVFAVHVRVDNPAHRLKPGMLAEAVLSSGFSE